MKYIPLILLALLQVVLNIILTNKRHDRISRIFTYFTYLLLVWTVINVLLDYGTAHSLLGLDLFERLPFINILNKAGFLLGGVLLVFIYQTVIVSQDVGHAEKSKPLIIVGLILSLSSILSVFSGEYYINNTQYVYHYGPASLMYAPFMIFLGWRVIRIATLKLEKSQTRLERKRTLSVLSALLLSAIWGLIFIVILPIITKKDYFVFIGYLAPYIFTLLMYYAIIWLGLFNFRQIIARSIGYLLSLAVLGVVFVLVLQLIMRYILRDTIPTNEILFFALISFVFALVFQPAKRYFDKLTNTLFYKDGYDAEEVFNKMSRTLVSANNINELLFSVAKLLTEELKFSFVAIQLRNHETIGWPNEKIRQNTHTLKNLYNAFSAAFKSGEEVVVAELIRDEEDNKIKSLFAENDISVIIRMSSVGRHNKQELGYIAFGQKRSGDMFTAQDISVIQSITNEVKLAVQNALHYEEIQQFNETLQQRVEEATYKLRVTYDKLKKIDEAKDEFISMASHQLRTPLTSVKGYVSMVLDGDVGPINDQQRELLNQSFMSSQRMANLISDLLNLSRINTGKFVIEPVPVDLRNIVETEIAQLREMAEGKGVTLIYDPPETYPVAMLDDGKMHQVVMNLIDNAIYYTPSGGVVTILVEETPTSLDLRVVDTGIGVPRDAQRHLFGKMFRAENARRARPDGTGLGLFMVKKVIVSQGGAIIFDSVEGKGSTFGFYFPKKTVLAPEGTEAITSRGQVRSEQ